MEKVFSFTAIIIKTFRLPNHQDGKNCFKNFDLGNYYGSLCEILDEQNNKTENFWTKESAHSLQIIVTLIILFRATLNI